MIVDDAAAAQRPADCILKRDDSKQSQKHEQMAMMVLATCLAKGIILSMKMRMNITTEKAF